VKAREALSLPRSPILSRAAAEHLEAVYWQQLEVDPNDEHWRLSRFYGIHPHEVVAAGDHGSEKVPASDAPSEPEAGSSLVASGRGLVSVEDGILAKTDLVLPWSARPLGGPGQPVGEEWVPRFLDKFTAYAVLASPQVVLIEHAPDAKSDGFAVVLDRCSGTSPITPSWKRIEVGEASEGVLVELVTAPVGAFQASVVDILVREGARLSYYWVDLSGSTRSVAQINCEIREGASLEVGIGHLGRGESRLCFNSELSGAGSSCELFAVALGQGKDYYDMRTLQVHQGASTRSLMASATVLDDEAEAVYDGLIVMRRGARGASAVQSNRNLLLSEECSASSVPNLNIEENDVRCDHASAVGPLDEEMLHYLRSRGIPEPAARALLVQGFFEEVLSGMSVTPVRDFLRATLKVRGRL
jgi:Fe-S cluster assembly protein SufD